MNVGRTIQVSPPSHSVSFVIRHGVQFFPRTLLGSEMERDITPARRQELIRHR